jgi:hypothetical protein
MPWRLGRLHQHWSRLEVHDRLNNPSVEGVFVEESTRKVLEKRKKVIVD